MTMITPSYLGETIEYSSLHACRSTLEDPTRQVDETLAGGVGHGLNPSNIEMQQLLHSIPQRQYAFGIPHYLPDMSRLLSK